MSTIIDVPEKVCRTCQESWPQTPEFWFRDHCAKRMRARLRRGEVPDLSNACKGCTLQQPGHLRQIERRRQGERRVRA